MSDLMKLSDVQLTGIFIDGIEPSLVDLARSVIVFAAMFPLLDLFAKLSNGNKVSTIPYKDQFINWYEQFSNDYIEKFHIEPLHFQTKTAENKVRGYFETLLKHKFPTVRPSWLRSEQTKGNLELDGYCEELHLAFEYQGEYHQIYVPVHHKQRTLAEVQANDELKMKICMQYGVHLIQIPYQERDNLSFVKEKLQELNNPKINELLSL